jgi:membrane protease subunit HflK
MEDVYANSNKVLMDGGQGNNLIYLPVDKILEQRLSSPAAASQPNRAPAASAAAEASAATRDREDRRTREAR